MIYKCGILTIIYNGEICPQENKLILCVDN